MPSSSSHLLRLFRSAQAVQWDVLPRNQTITDGSGVLDVATYNLTDNSGFQQIPANNGMTLRVGGGSTGAAGTITLSASLLLSGLTSSLPKGGGAYTLTGGGITLSNAESPFVIDADINLSTVLSGSGGFVKSGVGILNTSRRHTITGPVVITGGTFQKTGYIVGSVFGAQTDVTLSNCTYAVSPGSYNVSNQVYKSLTLLGGVTLKSSGDYQSDNGDIGFQNNILMVGSNIIHSTGGAYGKHNWFTGGFTGDSSAVVTLNNGAGFGVYGSLRAIIFSGGSWENYLGTIVNNGDLTISGTVNLTKATVTLPTTARRIGFRGNNCTARLGEVTGPGVLFDNGKTGCAWILGERNTTFSFVGSITGNVSLTKLGTGVLSLTGSNTLSGVTTVTAGSLSIGEGGTAGDLGTSPVVNNSNLIFNRTDTFTFANAISGTGTLDHSGTGTTTLAGALTYTGTTTVNQGTLVLPSGASAFSHDIDVFSPGILKVPGGTNLTGTHSGSGTINAMPGTLRYNGMDVQAPGFVRPPAFTGTYLSTAIAAPVISSPANGASSSIAYNAPDQTFTVTASDPGGYSPLTYSIVGVSGGSASFSGNVLTFNPDDSFSGDATITYRVTNSAGVYAQNTYVYHVTAFSFNIATPSGTIQALDTKYSGVFLRTDTPAVGVAAIVSGPSNGTANIVNPNGVKGPGSLDGNSAWLNYVPNAGYSGPDSVTYSVTVSGVTQTATITFDVHLLSGYSAVLPGSATSPSYDASVSSQHVVDLFFGGAAPVIAVAPPGSFQTSQGFANAFVLYVQDGQQIPSGTSPSGWSYYFVAQTLQSSGTYTASGSGSFAADGRELSPTSYSSNLVAGPSGSILLRSMFQPTTFTGLSVQGGLSILGKNTTFTNSQNASIYGFSEADTNTNTHTSTNTPDFTGVEIHVGSSFLGPSGSYNLFTWPGTASGVPTIVYSGGPLAGFTVTFTPTAIVVTRA